MCHYHKSTQITHAKWHVILFSAVLKIVGFRLDFCCCSSPISLPPWVPAERCLARTLLLSSCTMCITGGRWIWQMSSLAGERVCICTCFWVSKCVCSSEIKTGCCGHSLRKWVYFPSTLLCIYCTVCTHTHTHTHKNHSMQLTQYISKSHETCQVMSNILPPNEKK